MPDANLLRALARISKAPEPHAYVASQDASIPTALANYDDLRSQAATHPDAAIRIEALSLIELLREQDVEPVLLASSRNDPDPSVAEHARALLFRAYLAKTLLERRDMPAEQFKAYRRETRRLAADGLFQRRSAPPADET